MTDEDRKRVEEIRQWYKALLSNHDVVDLLAIIDRQRVATLADVVRVAKEIYEVMRDDIESSGLTSVSWDEQSDSGRVECRNYARAALRAMGKEVVE